MASGGLRSVVVYGEARAGEEAAVVEAHLERRAGGGPAVAVEAVVEEGGVLAEAEVGVDTQINLVLTERRAQVSGAADGGHRLVLVAQGDALFCHHEILPRALAYHREQAGVAVERAESGHVAVLHAAHVELDRGRACRPRHALGERVWGQEYVVYHARCGQTQPSGPCLEAPCGVNGVMVPLPMDVEFVAAEAVANKQRRGLLPLYGLRHYGGHAALGVAQHWPTVFPGARHECEHAAYGVPILENNAVPAAFRVVNDAALRHIREVGEVVFKDYALLVRAGDAVRTVAHLAAVAVLGP